MQTYALIRVGEQRNTPRIWLEGSRLALAGFDVAQRYDIEVDRTAKRLTLRLQEAGDRLVSRKEKGGTYQPIVDICNGSLLSMFAGLEQVRVIFEDGAVHIMPLASEARKQERLERLRSKLVAGTPLTVGSLSTGVGVMDYALHQGLNRGGIDTRLGFACDIEATYIEQCEAKNPVWNRDTIMLSAPVQEVAFDTSLHAKLPRPDICNFGIPCTGHSVAGRAKKGLSMGEADPNVGHLVAAFLAVTAALSPAIVVVENVVAYLSSASFFILQNQLQEWGYVVHTAVLRGSEFGCLEHRDRMALVAVTEGITFDLGTLDKSGPRHKLGDMLDPVADDSPRWSQMAGLKAKEARDLAAGKGFAMQTFTSESEHIGTLTRGYAKVRQTDPKIMHPHDPALLRQLSATEHARIKEVPPILIEGMCETRAHESLGQSVLVRPFAALGAALAASLLHWLSNAAAPASEPFALV